MLISNLRLRTITTGLFHYEDAKTLAKDLCMITGDRTMFPFMFAAKRKAVLPWLRLHLPDTRFWNEELDLHHGGITELPDPSAADRLKMCQLFCQLFSRQMDEDALVANTEEGLA